MNKKRRMEAISKSIELKNKLKFEALSHDEDLKTTIKEKAAEMLSSLHNLKVRIFLFFKVRIKCFNWYETIEFSWAATKL